MASYRLGYNYSSFSIARVRMRGLRNCRETRRVGEARRREARLQQVLKGEIRLRRNRIMQPPSREMPRLTGYLRAFGEVSSPVAREPVAVDEALLRRKQKRREADSKPEKEWLQLKEEVLARCRRSDMTKASQRQRLLGRVK